jgi:hypothetical protein
MLLVAFVFVQCVVFVVSYSTGLLDPGPVYYGIPRSYCHFHMVGHPPVLPSFDPEAVNTTVSLVDYNGTEATCYQPERSYYVNLTTEGYTTKGVLLTSKREGGWNDNVSDKLGSFNLQSAAVSELYQPSGCHQPAATNPPDCNSPACANSVTQKKALTTMSMQTLSIPWTAPASAYPVSFVYALVFTYKQYVGPRTATFHSCESKCVLTEYDFSEYAGEGTTCGYAANSSFVLDCALRYNTDKTFGWSCTPRETEWMEVSLSCANQTDSWTLTANVSSAVVC